VKEGGGRPITVVVERNGTHVRLRATPQNGMLGLNSTGVFFDRGESCSYVEPPFMTNPIPAPMPEPPVCPNPN
jgi:hypothetical protein